MAHYCILVVVHFGTLALVRRGTVAGGHYCIAVVELDCTPVLGHFGILVSEHFGILVGEHFGIPVLELVCILVVVLVLEHFGTLDEEHFGIPGVVHYYTVVVEQFGIVVVERFDILLDIQVLPLHTLKEQIEIHILLEQEQLLHIQLGYHILVGTLFH